MNKFLLLFINDQINDNIPYLTKLDITGFNTGNLLFTNALKNQLHGEIVIGFDQAENHLQSECIIILSSNFLKEYSDFNNIATQIEKTNLPCLMAGVGAQSNSYSKIPVLKEGMLRFMKVVSERTKFVGARGAYSAEVLNYYGIKNVKVIGCPSIFTSCKPTTKIIKKNSEYLKIVCNG